MMYVFVRLDDGTEVVYSDVYTEDGAEKIRVYFERPVEGDFESAECILPNHKWNNDGYPEERLEELKEYLSSVEFRISLLARSHTENRKK